MPGFESLLTFNSMESSEIYLIESSMMSNCAKPTPKSICSVLLLKKPDITTHIIPMAAKTIKISNTVVITPLTPFFSIKILDKLNLNMFL